MVPAVRTTCSISVWPPARCSTFARLDFIRVPRPAARITTLVWDVIAQFCWYVIRLANALRGLALDAVPSGRALPIVVQPRPRRADRGAQFRPKPEDRWPLPEAPFPA